MRVSQSEEPRDRSVGREGAEELLDWNRAGWRGKEGTKQSLASERRKTHFVFGQRPDPDPTTLCAR